MMKKAGGKGSALFKQSKDSEEVLVAQEKQRHSLLKSLSRSIKEVQVMFANLSADQPGQASLSDCRPAERVCAQFEGILRHGLKSGWFGGESTFWPVILKVSRKQAIQYIKNLQYAQTDNGRCRAWIRMAVNECSLESYINVICQDSKLLSYYYEAHSFLRTPDMVSALTQLLVGLTELTFKLTVDTASLEFEAAPEVANSALPKLRIRGEEKQSSNGKDLQKGGQKVSKESKENGLIVDNLSVGGVSSEGSGCGDPTPTHTTHSPPAESETPPIVNGDVNQAMDSLEEFFEHHLVASSVQPPTPDSKASSDDGDLVPEPSLALTEQLEETLLCTEHEVWTGPVSDTLEPNGEVGTGDALKPIPSESPPGPGPIGPEEMVPPEDSTNGAMVSSLSAKESQDLYLAEQFDIVSKSDSHVSGDPSADDGVVSKSADDLGTPTLVMEELFTSNKEDATRTPASKEPPREDETQRIEELASQNDTVTRNTNPFQLTDTHLNSSPVGVATNLQQAVEADKRESIVSHDTIMNDEESVGSSADWGSRSSRDHTPSRHSTNPFFDSDEEDMFTRNRFVTNPFAEDDPHTLTSSQAHDRPVSFNAPLSTQQLSSNPFLDDVTPMATSGNYGNRPHLQEQSSIDSVDTPTIEKLLPPVPPIENSIQNQFDQKSNETTPSISPVSFLREHSPDSASTASSQDLSIILERTWEQVPYPIPLGPSASLSSPTEDHFGAELSQAELITEINRLKTQLKHGGMADGGDLRRKVVSLQLRLQQIRDTEEEEGVGDSCQEVFGHRLVRQPRHTKLGTALPTCEGCRKQVRGIIRHWYLCKSCGCASHKGCLSKIARRCNQLNKIKEDARYTLEVCPEKGLTQQKFRCGSCTQAFNKPNSGGARLCDYSGLYHCKQCHLNDEAVIPARVVHNWDFKARKVCSHCSDLLSQLSTKALIVVKEENPHLYTHVTDLSVVESLKDDLLLMKSYFLQCRLAREAQLLQQLNQFLHYMTDVVCYSLSDLQAMHDGTLLPRLQEAHKEYTNHIKGVCPLCSGKGYMCELCGSEEVLFPFDRHTSQCEKCNFVFHKACFTEMTSCPRCERLKERFR